MNDLLKSTIRDLLAAYRAKQVSPVEICREALDRIDRHDPVIGAFLTIDRESILGEAAEAEKHLDRPLAGVPIAIKDVISTRGIETTCSSRILRGNVPPYDATVIERLREAGAIIFGKTNCDEFAMGSSTENSAYRLTRNPWNTSCAPGGSSGGSAAAVASCFAFAALGSDTGGSVRQPAAFCGIVGLKPTYGRVSRYGLVAFGSSLDCIGTLTRSAGDAALLLQVISGKDPKDSTSSSESVPDYLESIGSSEKLRIGVPEEYFRKGIDSEVADIVRKALSMLAGQNGIELLPVSLPHSEYAIATYYVIATAEASSNLSRFDGVRYGVRVDEPVLRTMYERTRDAGFGAEVKRRIMLGTFVLSAGYYDAYYQKASRVRSLIAQDFQKAFEKVDLICGPTTPTPAFPIGEKVNDPLAMYLSDVFTVTMSLSGLPAISVPCGKTSTGMPVGLQIVANHFEEKKLFAMSSEFAKYYPVEVPELQ
jgi:aspartyl-tRNA(Asn)/glutamyl-tRNA(Gln) amidotransferase subunit A